VERVAHYVLSLLPPPEPPPALVSAPEPTELAELTQEQVEVIAKRVLDLARPLIEQIAWEVIPDMSEMLIRQRIRELEAGAEQEN